MESMLGQRQRLASIARSTEPRGPRCGAHFKSICRHCYVLEVRMNKLRSLAMWLVIASGAVSVALAADKKPEPFTKERLHEIAATVESIDVPTRTVSLKGPKGNVQTIVVDPEVRNLENIHVGDKVHVGYYEGVVAEIKDKSDTTSTTSSEPAGAVATYRAPPGSKPAAAAGRAVNATVKIQSVDTKASTVTFIRPDGLWRTL